MATQPTQDPVPSESPRDLKFNAGKIDEYVTSMGWTYTDRFGQKHYTIEGMNYLSQQAMAAYGYVILTGKTFTTGATLNNPNEVLLNTADGEYYKWTGSFASGGKVVPANSTPAGTGGIGPGAWIGVGDASLRAALAAPGGVNLVNGAASIDYVDSEIDDITEKLSLFAYESCSSVGVGSGNIVSIDVFGDSTMWGATPGNLGTQDVNNPPNTLKKTLLNLGYNTTVNNKAISGSTLDQMIKGTDGSGQTFEQRISASSSKVIYCNHAINDNNQNNNILTFRNNWVTFVNICRKYGKIPVIVTPNPNPPIGLITEVVSKRLKNYADVAKDVAKAMKVDLVDNFYYLTAALPLFHQSYLVPDGAHMITLGYRLAGQNLAIPFVNTPLLKNDNDSLSLANVTYYDTFTTGRMMNQSGEHTGITLTGIKATAAGINIPIILDCCTEDSILVMYGTQSSDATSASFSYNGDAFSTQFSGGAIQKDARVGNKFNALYLPEYCNLTPGLHVLGLSFNTSSEDGKYIGIGGFKLMPRQKMCRNLNYDPVTTRTMVSGTFDWSSSGNKLQFTDKTGTKVLLKIENDGTGIKATLDGVTTTIASGAGSKYDYAITFNLTNVVVLIGSVTVTLTITTPLPDMYVIPQTALFFKQVV